MRPCRVGSTTSARRRWLALLALAALVLVPALAHAAPSEFESLRSRGWLWAYLGVFAAGVLTSLTPCVYPMIPIVVGIFGARDERVSRARAFLLATMYVAGMGAMFSALGVGVALTGKAFGTLLADPRVVIPLVIFYAVLAASMFGAFELSLPSSVQGRLASVGGKGMGGAFAMGLVGGLTAAPCTGPILAGILAFVATTRNVPVGFTLLFTYALGIGVLFWLIATFAVTLPKSGRWMEGVKSVAGIALLLVGAYFLRPIWPALAHASSPGVGFLAGAIGIAAVGVALGGVHLSFHGTRPAIRTRKAIGLVLAVGGLVGVINWGLTPRRSLAWRHDEQVALAEARGAGRPAMIDFGAEQCAPCKQLEIRVFADPEVYAELSRRFVTVKIDLTHGDDAAFDAQERWKAPALPTVILVGSDGNERRRWVGEPLPTPAEFLAALRQVR